MTDLPAAKISLKSSDALLVVDIQNDFLPGGALGVAGGDEVVPVLNRCVMLFQERDLPVFVTRDWHTPGFHRRTGDGLLCAEHAPGRAPAGFCRLRSARCYSRGQCAAR